MLKITGAGGAPNTIVVSQTADHQSLTASLSFPWRTANRTYNLTVPFSRGIRLIVINGGNKSDSITIDQTNGAFSILTKIYTHNGNDTVTGGDEPDYVKVGNGIDVVSSGEGNDSLFAGLGPDTLIGGNGNDQIHAGPGRDAIVAGNGTDAFIDPFGHNTITAGTGHDVYILKDIKLDPTNFDSKKDIWKPYKGNSSDNHLVGNIVNGVLDYLL